jgi:hypothetical protein
MGAPKSQTLNVQTPNFNEGLAQRIIQDAIQKQSETEGKLLSRGDYYKGLEKEAQFQLGSLFGRSGEEARKSYEEAFAAGIPNIKSEFETRQSFFNPRVIKSSSYADLADSLKGSAQEYTAGMRGATEEASSRLYQALMAPSVAFDAVAQTPTFNKLYDPRFMSLATKPPTVQSDVDSMKSLYTYNV